MSNRKIYSLLLSLTSVLVLSCGQQKGINEFAGVYDDEFNNHYELYDDHTAIIQFAGETERITSKWAEKRESDKHFAVIEYNGNPAYYYLYNGALYRTKENMESGHCAIEIK
ncbi:MAG: hypothetical protein J5965_01135 [Aeriscardovia sp.]|nr:hypothetical protein [Aeriscardovia sp.]